jgi:hypothetical protein
LRAAAVKAEAEIEGERELPRSTTKARFHAELLLVSKRNHAVRTVLLSFATAIVDRGDVFLSLHSGPPRAAKTLQIIYKPPMLSSRPPLPPYKPSMSLQELVLDTLGDDAPPLVDGRDLLLLRSTVAAAAAPSEPAAAAAVVVAAIGALSPDLLSCDSSPGAPAAAAAADTGRGLF